MAVLIGLGTWQVQRRAWKLDLIARVEARVHAPPVAAPGMVEWGQIDAAGYEYRHVSSAGTFLHGKATLVAALTELGSGFWVLTPLRLADGSAVLVNRGFVPAGWPGQGGEAQASVTGLLRITEPGGTLLRSNDPAAGRWYSRDVAAIAQARALAGVAPYFIDADAGPAQPDAPVGGLTIVSFRNNHLVYALTWYALAIMLAVACATVVRRPAPP